MGDELHQLRRPEDAPFDSGKRHHPKRADDPRPENVYAFARAIFQSVHYWPRDGQADYGKNIFEASYYLTPRFQEELSADMDRRGKNGELAGRVRPSALRIA